ncbi:MAG TPA: CBS domain-containing protein [Gaiellaceae bacterium]|nr:CBS domain-containing protein [Gaiellaceae bacterium]
MRVQDVMTTDVVTVVLDTPLKEVAALLSERRISGVPVVDTVGVVLGIVSEADVLAKEAAEARGRGTLLDWLLDVEPLLDKLSARTAGDAMTAPAIDVGPRRPLHEAASIMLEHGVNRLPVVEHGRLVGIVTRADLVRAFVRSDAEIAEEIEREVLGRTLWLGPGEVEVTVRDGDVRLVGTVAAATEAELLPRLVRRLPGVISVTSEVEVRPRERTTA